MKQPRWIWVNKSQNSNNITYPNRNKHVYLSNSLKPSRAFMRQYIIKTLVQIMACHLFGTKPYLNQCRHIVQTPSSIFQGNLNSKVFIQENALENVVCEMRAIFFYLCQCVNEWRKAVIKPCHHWFRCWLVSCSLPSHIWTTTVGVLLFYPLNEIQATFRLNTCIFLHEIDFANTFCKWQSFGLGDIETT